jgi:hypothetical protein
METAWYGSGKIAGVSVIATRARRIVENAQPLEK